MSASTIDPFRLPLNVRPTHYDLTVLTDLKTLKFEGFVKIRVNVEKETSSILLNTNALNITKSTVESSELGSQPHTLSPSLDSKTQRANFTLPKSLPVGSSADLTIAYNAELSDSGSGYYRSSWTSNGETKYYSLTQFESTQARRALPCWDEPMIKAKWNVTMISRADTVNLSNMPATSEQPFDPSKSEFSEIIDYIPSTKELAEGWKITKFDTTPLMSSYLLAFANGPFKHLESSVKMPLSGRDVKLRIYATEDLIHQGQFALDVTAKVLPIYEKMFEIEFPLPKLDTLVATDYEAGAMENWGLITGRTTYYLMDPGSTSQKARKGIIDTQSHEVSHMWFGNITTPEWWDTLYLKEGFATLMGEVIIPNIAYPELRPNSEFLNDHLQAALVLDAKPSSHPIEVPCPDPDEVGQIFDSLSYSKAGSVLRMLLNFVGEEKFIKGVSTYLKAHLYSNSVTKDLWTGIGKTTGLDIAKIMDNWILKKGFPLITVTEVDGGIKVRQDRFLDSGEPSEEENQVIWNVPLFLQSTNEDGSVNIDNSALLTEREGFFKLDTSKPFKLNAGTYGLYRVRYSAERLEKIAVEAAKSHSAFSLDDRIGLVADSMALAKVGFTKTSDALTLVNLLREEKEYLVWAVIAGNLTAINSIWYEHDGIVKHLSSFRRSLFSPLVKRLGYDYAKDESPDVSKLRTLAIMQAGSAGDEGVISELQKRFHHYMETGDDSQIHPDLETVTYQCVVRHGGVKEYEAVEKIRDKAKTPQSAVAAIHGLCCARDPELVDRTFDSMINRTRITNVRDYMARLAAEREHRRKTVAYFKANYDTIYRKFENNYMFQFLVSNVFGTLSTKKDLAETEEFFKDKDRSRYHMAYAQTLDSIRSRAQYAERATDDVAKWLEQW